MPFEWELKTSIMTVPGFYFFFPSFTFWRRQCYEGDVVSAVPTAETNQVFATPDTHIHSLRASHCYFHGGDLPAACCHRERGIFCLVWSPDNCWTGSAALWVCIIFLFVRNAERFALIFFVLEYGLANVEAGKNVVLDYHCLIALNTKMHLLMYQLITVFFVMFFLSTGDTYLYWMCSSRYLMQSCHDNFYSTRVGRGRGGEPARPAEISETSGNFNLRNL